MPELPEVEGFRRRFARASQGRLILEVVATDEGILRNTTPSELDHSLRGCRFDRPQRHGKWLIAATDGPTVLLHFGLTGDVVRGRDGSDRPLHGRVIFIHSDGDVRYRNLLKCAGTW